MDEFLSVKALPLGNNVHFVTSASNAELLNNFCRERTVRAMSFANFLVPALLTEQKYRER